MTYLHPQPCGPIESVVTCEGINIFVKIVRTMAAFCSDAIALYSLFVYDITVSESNKIIIIRYIFYQSLNAVIP